MSTDTQAFTTVEVGSTRSFGLVFSTVFAIVGLYPLMSGSPVRVWAILAATAFLFLSFFFSKMLQPLNLLWFRLGMLLGRIINPVVMLVLYMLTIVPFGIVMRLARKDPLRLELDDERLSYWIPRDPPGPEPESLENQF
jgi:hypothetical protein